MSVYDEFKARMNRNLTFQNREALDQNKEKAKELIEQKQAFLAKFETLKANKLKSDSHKTTFNDMEAFETYLILNNGVLAGVKNVEDGNFYFEFAFPKSKTKKTYTYYFVSEFDNNSQLRPNFDIIHIVDEDKRAFYAKTCVRSAVVTAQMLPTTEIVAPGTDKALGIDFDALHKSMPIAQIKDYILGEQNLKQKAITDRQKYQLNSIKKGL